MARRSVVSILDKFRLDFFGGKDAFMQEKDGSKMEKILFMPKKTEGIFSGALA